MAEFFARMSTRTIIGCALLAALIGNAALSGVAGSSVRELALVTALMLGVMAAAGAIAVTAGRLHSGGRTVAYHGAVKRWYRNGVLHRDDGAALTFNNGWEFWYRDGKLVPHGGELPPAISCEAPGWLRARLDELEHRIGLHREAHENCAACAYVARL